MILEHLWCLWKQNGDVPFMSCRKRWPAARSMGGRDIWRRPRATRTSGSSSTLLTRGRRVRWCCRWMETQEISKTTCSSLMWVRLERRIVIVITSFSEKKQKWRNIARRNLQYIYSVTVHNSQQQQIISIKQKMFSCVVRTMLHFYITEYVCSIS